MKSELVLMGPYAPPQGGVARFNENLSFWLSRQGEQHSILPYSQNKIGGIAPYRLTFRDFFPHAIKLPYRAVCLDSAGFLLEYPSPGAVRAWLMARSVKRLYWMKVIHDGSLPERYAKLQEREKHKIRDLAGKVDEFIAVNDDLAQWLRDDLGVTKAVHVVASLLPPLTDEQHGSGAKERRKDKTHAARVLCIGAFTPLYGFLDVAIAVEKLRSERSLDVSLVLIDSGFAEDRNYRLRVLDERPWITVSNSVPHSELLQVLESCDVFVRACAKEGYGLSRVEALWQGVPVVATRVGEQRGMLLFDYGDVEALQERISEALVAPPFSDIVHWAGTFRAEASENLGQIMHLIAERRERP